MTTEAGIAEYERRVAAVRELMAQEGLDALVAADSHQWMLPGGHVRYLSDFRISGEGLPTVTAVVVPHVGDPVLVMPAGVRGSLMAWAEQTSWIKQIRPATLDRMSLEHGLVRDVARTLEDCGAAKGRIGLCGGFPGIEALGDLLAQATVAPATVTDANGNARDIIERARQVKSAWEVDRMATAQQYVEESMRAFMAAAKPGRTLASAIAYANWVARSLGGEETMIVMNAGTDPWMWWTYQGDRKFADGQLVSLESNVRVDGYIAQLARSGVIGEPTADQARVIDTTLDSLTAMSAELAAGVTGGQLWEAAIAPINDAGFVQWARLGHGMGLSMAEGLDVSQGDDNVVRNDHVVELHAAVLNPQTNASAIIGDQFVIENGQARPLSRELLPHRFAPGG